MKKHKACADDGIVAEILKESATEVVEIIAATFCDLINGETQVPDAWT